MKTRKQYVKPQMKKYGSIRQLTLAQATGKNRDGAMGPRTTKTGL